MGGAGQQMPVRSFRLAAIEGHASSYFEKQGVATTPLGRVGKPDDIGGPVAFLASDDAHWITGAIVYASGGAAI
jgi:NAD(P)-dependent dehydrogenase (short-subunit alcohol dehydrogenase family)